MVQTYNQYLDTELVDDIQNEMELSLDNGDFSNDEWIEGKSMESEYVL